VSKVRMVQKVKGLEPYHQALSLPNLELPRNTCIQRKETGSFQDIPARGAKRPSRIDYKRAGVKPAGRSADGGAIGARAGRGVTYDVSAVLLDASYCRVSAAEGGKVIASAIAYDGRELPVTG